MAEESIAKKANYVPLVVPGLSTSSSSSSSPASPTSSSQEAVNPTEFPASTRSECEWGSTGKPVRLDQEKRKNQRKMMTTRKYEATRRMICQSGHRSSGTVWWMTVFLNAETHTPVLLMNFHQSRQQKWYRVSTAFLLTYRRTEIAMSAWEPKLLGLREENALVRSVPRAENFGDLIPADHNVLSERCKSRNNHRHAVVQDLATQRIRLYPHKHKTSQETQKSLQKFLEPNRKPKVIYTDNSLEFGKSCEDLLWNHCTSTPHRSETNGFAERAVRRVKESTSVVLLQSGLNEKWLADSLECYTYLRKRHRFTIWWEDAPWKDVLENHLKDRSFRLVHWLSITLSAKDQSRIHEFGSGEARGGAELVAVRRGVAFGQARSPASVGEVVVSGYDGSRTQPPHHGGRGGSSPNLCEDVWPTVVQKSGSAVECFQSYIRHDSHPDRKKQVCVMNCRRYPDTGSGRKMVGRFHGMLYLSSKHSRSLVWWEDTLTLWKLRTDHRTRPKDKSDAPAETRGNLPRTSFSSKETEDKATFYSPYEDTGRIDNKTQRKESLWWTPEQACTWSARETLTLPNWRPWGHQKSDDGDDGQRRGVNERRSDRKCQTNWTYSCRLCFLKKLPPFFHSGSSARIMGIHTTGPAVKNHISPKMTRGSIAIHPNYVPFVVPGLSASSTSTTPTSSSSSSQDSVFGVNRYTENQVQERSGNTSGELREDPLHETTEAANKNKNEGRE